MKKLIVFLGCCFVLASAALSSCRSNTEDEAYDGADSSMQGVQHVPDNTMSAPDVSDTPATRNRGDAGVESNTMNPEGGATRPDSSNNMGRSRTQ